MFALCWNELSAVQAIGVSTLLSCCGCCYEKVTELLLYNQYIENILSIYLIDDKGDVEDEYVVYSPFINKIDVFHHRLILKLPVCSFFSSTFICWSLKSRDLVC